MENSDYSTPYREQVYEAFANRSKPFETAVEDALSAGIGRLKIGVGFLTRIDDGTQYIEHSVGEHDAIQAGESCPLDEAYCRRTVDIEGNLCVQDAKISPDVADAAYEQFGLGAYIGTKVMVDDQVYGTICFGDREPKREPFSEAQELFVELIARLVGQAIERREYEQQQAERTAELAAQRQRFEGIAQNSFDILYRIDVSGRFTFVSDAVTRITGYEPDELVGTEFTEYLVDETTPAATDAFERLRDGESVQQLEVGFVHRNGTVVSLEINATAITSDDTETVIQGVARDITERKEREAELRIRTEAMDAAAVPMTIADATKADNPIIYANDAFEQVTGYTQHDILGNNCRMLQGAKTDPERVSTLREAVTEKRPTTVQLLNYRRDGTPFWNRVTITPITDDTGTVVRYLGFQQDVTEQERIVRLVELLNRVLRHNLRNELTVIQGYVDLIDEQPPGIDLTSRLMRPLRRLISLSDSARDLERLANTERNPARLVPEDLLHDIAETSQNEHPSARITVALESERNICAGRELSTALEELIQNAITHDPEDGTNVSLSTQDDGEWVVITVQDDGPGIPDSEVAVIESGHETQMEHGKGLGLWLVNWIVTHYGGSFQLTADDGTVAQLRLPAIADEQAVEDVARKPTALLR
jgi:PAS domain S-box-containing protein